MANSIIGKDNAEERAKEALALGIRDKFKPGMKVRWIYVENKPIGIIREEVEEADHRDKPRWLIDWEEKPVDSLSNAMFDNIAWWALRPLECKKSKVIV